MIIESTKFFWAGDLGWDLTLRTRTLETHSRMQQLTPEMIEELKHQLAKVIKDEIFEYVVNNTKSSSA